MRHTRDDDVPGEGGETGAEPLLTTHPPPHPRPDPPRSPPPSAGERCACWHLWLQHDHAYAPMGSPGFDTCLVCSCTGFTPQHDQ